MLQKNKATFLLFLMMILFILSYPYRDGFWGGLFNAGMLAAVIGGLADWFAVRALFEKPLGIGYRTEVIPRNREQIFCDMITFISKDLLGKENIIRVLDRYSLMKLALTYVDESKGDEKIKQFLYQMVTLFLKESNKEQLAKILENLLQEKVKEMNTIKPVIEALIHTLERDEEDAFIKELLVELEVYVHHPAVVGVIEQIVTQIKQQYTGQAEMREMASRFLDLSEEKIAKMVQREIIQYLRDLQFRTHPLRIDLKVRIIEWLLNQKENKQLEESLNQFLEYMINEKLNVSNAIVNFLNVLLEEQKMNLRRLIDQIVDNQIQRLRSDDKLQEKCEQFMKEIVMHVISEKHIVLETKIREKLDGLSNDDLKNLVENRVGDDLQMIRINGSVVGAIAGMMLYVLTFLVERFV
ncbi:DUF445 domain-containing protein [Anaerosinus gibii]|uniref:DUF445 domain-containing protein n=1 Tax=Selenobaculum gibii TaxID=3054208 RepID=A0A9Y2AER3_9FIRM|nr:DUF445 domain-containing protein [Selenobaculum gbiensis]WIW70225.1 DUF445 domain-containing protein [Selenobaculum gbiensis]